MLCGTTASGGFLVVSGERVLNCYNFCNKTLPATLIVDERKLLFWKKNVFVYKCDSWNSFVYCIAFSVLVLSME